jgi:hypothetical protein
MRRLGGKPRYGVSPVNRVNDPSISVVDRLFERLSCGWRRKITSWF